jgi:hypothetical protein
LSSKFLLRLDFGRAVGERVDNDSVWSRPNYDLLRCQSSLAEVLWQSPFQTLVKHFHAGVESVRAAGPRRFRLEPTALRCKYLNLGSVAADGIEGDDRYMVT